MDAQREYPQPAATPPLIVCARQTGAQDGFHFVAKNGVHLYGSVERCFIITTQRGGSGWEEN